MNFKSKITQLHYDKNAEGFFVDLLEFFSLFYGLVSKLRNTLYDKGVLKEKKVNANVISVGISLSLFLILAIVDILEVLT